MAKKHDDMAYNKDISERSKRINRLKLIVKRMESILKSTADAKLSLEPWAYQDVDYEELKAGWAYRPEEKVIKYPTEGPLSIDNLDDYQIISQLLHEIGHARYTGAPNITDIPEPYPAFIQLVNTMEDVRSEFKLMRRYPGTYDSLKVVADFLKEGLQDDKMLEHPEYINFLMNILRLEWEYPLILSDKAKTVYDTLKQELEDAFFAEDIDDLINNHILGKIWDTFKTLIEDPNDGGGGQGNGQGQGQRQGQKDQDDWDDFDQPSGSGGGGDEDEEENQKQGQGQADDKYDEVESIKDLMTTLSDNFNKPLDPETMDALKNPLKAKKSKEQKEATADSDCLVSGHQDEKEYYGTQIPTYEELHAMVHPYIGYFTKKLNSILVDNRLKRFGGAYSRGKKLNNKILYKWKCKSTRLFSKPILRLHKDYAVALCIDESGSMSGQQILEAAKSAVLLAEVLNKCDIPFEIYGFAEEIQTYKTLNRPFNWTIKRNMEQIIRSCFFGNCGATNDAYSVNKAVRSLKLHAPQSESIVMVVTDGGSNTTSETIPQKDQQQLPKNIRHKVCYSDYNIKEEVGYAKQDMAVIGLGILTDYVHGVYPQSAYIDDISSLPKKVLNLIKRNIKRG